LNSVSVTVGGVAAPLSYVSATQINALVPFEAATLTATQTATVPLIVKTPGGTSSAFNVKLIRDAPAIYTKNQSGTGPALVFDPNFNAITTVGTSPIVLYATGLGPTNPAAVTGALGAGTEPLNRIQDLVSVSIGQTSATVLFAGLAPGLEGIYQINVTPQTPTLGNVLAVSVGSYSTTPTTLPVIAGTNVTNVTGSIYGLYPASGAAAAGNGGNSTSGPIAYSALLTSAAFTANFDILPGAQPFSVVAQSSEGGGVTATIAINPTQNTWQATYTVPTALTRQGNFSQSGITVVDFLNGGVPFPGDIIPASRLDPLVATACSALPLPNAPVGSASNGTWTSSGTLPTGGHFSTSLIPPGVSASTSFGGFVNIPNLPGTNTVTFQLYVDSELVASAPVSFTEQY
jgi:uncharacterized protein (TIGR03437 family)